MSRWLLALVLALCAAGPRAAPALSTCVGRFPDLVSDVCWSCMMPITLGANVMATIGTQEDNGNNPSNPMCSCVVNPTVGIATGFWEPARIIEVVRKPFCLVSLGGVDVDPGVRAPESGRSAPTATVQENFYQAHYYSTAVASMLSLLMDSPCLEKGAFDLVYMTELDPLWSDDLLSLILNPEVMLFANPIAVAACAADCVASTLGFGRPELFWCAGCQGGLFPLVGRTSFTSGGVQSSELVAQRVLAKMHRQFLAHGWDGPGALCGPYLKPVMDKSSYKLQMLHPLPQTRGAGESRCCQPMGRSTVLWGSGREYPALGEDFTYLVFRKRNCCVGY